MIRTKLAKKVLTKAEQKHLTKVGGIHSMAALERQVKFMLETEKETPNSVCFECWHIAMKLGLVE